MALLSALLLLVQPHAALAQTLRPKAALDAALLQAAQQDNAAQVKALLAKGADAHVRGNHGWTPFMFVAVKGDASSMRALLRAGADIDGRDADGQTALMAASWLGWSRAVRLLLSMGANANLAASDGSTARTGTSFPDVVQMLLLRGARPNAQDAGGTSALIFATSQQQGPTTLNRQFYARRLRIVRLLLAHGADPNLKRRNGYTALMAASRQGNTEMVTELLRSHANVNARDSKGRSALDFAVLGKQDTVARLLRAAGARP